MLTKHITIPSRGMYYPEGHPLHQKQTVQVKLLTAKQQDILTDQALAKSGQTIKVLIDNIIVDKSIKQNSLLSGDRAAILVKTRQLSLGASYKFNWPCSNCKANNLDQVDLGKFEFKGTPEKPGQPIFQQVLPTTGKLVKFKLFTRADQQAIRKIQNNRKKAKLRPAMVTTRLIQSIMQVDGNADVGQITKFVEQMPARDAKYIRDKMAQMSPDLDMTVNLVCSSCESQREVMLPITAAFFQPSD